MTNASNYYPDKWLIIEINDRENAPLHKVFGTWSGSYLYGDSWRMNSGIVGVHSKGGHITIAGNSGSHYIVSDKNYGATVYGANIISDLIRKSESWDDCTIRVLDEDEGFLTLEDYVGR